MTITGGYTTDPAQRAEITASPNQASDKGENTLELAAMFPGSRLTDDPKAPVPTALNAVPFGGPNDVNLYIKPEKFSEVFLSHRVDESRAAVLAASQRPLAAVTGSEPTKAAAWKSIPSWYLVATDDRTIGTDNLRFMAKAPVPTALNAVPFGGPNDVNLYIKPEKFSEVFLSHRVDESRAAVLAASQRPLAAVTGSEPTKAAAWKSIPSWYLVATDDRTIGTDNLRFMAKRAGSTTIEVDAPHDVMETNSGEVTDLILQAAQGSRPSLAQTGTGERGIILGSVAVLAIAGGASLVIRSRRA